jgi:drug/metabolite transporter (DMT)-like permease
MELKRYNTHMAMFALLAGAVMISFSGVWVKIAQVAPDVSAFYRVFFGGLILLPAAWRRGEIQWRGFKHLLLGLICGICFALDLGFYHASIQYVGPGLGTILPNFQVFILAAMGVAFLGERIRLIYLISIPLAFVGLFLIVGLQWDQLGRVYKIGVYFGLIAAVCYAGFLLSLRKLQSDQTGISIFYVLTLVSFITAALLGLVVVFKGGSFRIPDGRSFLSLLALGLFSQSIGWILITNALPKIRASLSGLVLLLQPALAFVWDVLLFERPTSSLSWLGVSIVLTAIYMGTIRRAAPPSRTDSR